MKRATFLYSKHISIGRGPKHTLADVIPYTIIPYKAHYKENGGNFSIGLLNQQGLHSFKVVLTLVLIGRNK